MLGWALAIQNLKSKYNRHFRSGLTRWEVSIQRFHLAQEPALYQAPKRSRRTTRATAETTSLKASTTGTDKISREIRWPWSKGCANSNKTATKVITLGNLRDSRKLSSPLRPRRITNLSIWMCLEIFRAVTLISAPPKPVRRETWWALSLKLSRPGGACQWKTSQVSTTPIWLPGSRQM